MRGEREKEKEERHHLRACVRKREREDEGKEGMELSWKRDTEGETLGKLGVEGCKESPSWQTGRSSACANIFRMRFLRIRVENSASKEEERKMMGVV